MNTELKEVLIDGLDYMKRVPKNLHFLTNAVADGNVDSIKKNYEDLREGLHYIIDALDNFEHFLKLDYSEIFVSRQSAQKIKENYHSLIGGLEKDFGNEDYKNLAEKVETELPKHLKKLISVFNQINKLLNEKGH